ncbi:glycosyltransferase [Arenibacter lacus]|uniref:glycosyltransferase n=1 Tax=Arenibacter lacus TaxID=2608629 RepID=UPI00123D9965|nr:glycosyltransferase [Arenibacter lacus]
MEVDLDLYIMNILYVSTACSKKTITKILTNPNIKFAQASQKFNRLLIDGFINEKANIVALSSIPVNASDIKDLNIKKKEMENEIEFIYTKSFYNRYINVISSFLSSFYHSFMWGVKNKGGNSIIICDVLKVSICMGALFASKILQIKTLGIVTDIPGLMTSSNLSFFSKFATYLNKKYITNFDSYVLLTEQMNELVNPHKRPYKIMEGLVDSSMIIKDAKNKEYPRNILYAGGIFKRYGVKTLVDAFMNISDDSIRLSIYGHGDLEEFIKKSSQEDHRVNYYGVVPNSEVVEAQLKATLLVNPRPTHEEFTKYSFPSKNMEYMVSGTPVLTTNLPGMPKEYREYVYLIEEEDVNGVENTLRKLISTNEKELFYFGAKAKEFVLSNKNNIIQSKRVLDFISTINQK